VFILLEGEERTLCISCHLLWREKHYWRLNGTYSKKYYQFFMFNMITTKYAFHFNSLWISNHCTTTIHSKGFLWGHFVMTWRSQSGEHPKDCFPKFAHIQDMKAKIFKHSFYMFSILTSNYLLLSTLLNSTIKGSSVTYYLTMTIHMN